MIKMVCSDLDGTLLQYGKKLIEGEIFDEIRALHDRGILFCPASGRQYTSLRKLFAPVADDCIYLCENGAVVYRGGKVIAKTPMPRALAEEIAWDFWNNTEDLGEVMLSGENMSYLMERGHGVVDRIKFIGNNYTVITDPAQIPEDIVKVSVYLVDGVEPFVERFVPKWQQANCAVAGPKWIDTTVANKGIGVQSICRVLGIDPADVMAFGDNYNDVAMLETVVLLSQQKPDDTIEIDLDLDELDATSAELKATYQEIKDYVLKEFGLKVSSLYISQVKRKCGIEVGENYNLPKSENARVPQCPKEKEDAIKAALKYYAMI